ncbi:MAG: hypothetical protein ABSH06_14655 [Thermodesulfobacteriota bacterium]
MRKNILLVEPAYNNPYPPLGLMKISTWHKKKGDEVQLIKDSLHNDALDRFEENERCYKKLKEHYDIIYITSLFTYQAQYVIQCIRYYKNKFPDARIRVGGIMATLIPEYIKKKTGVEPHVGLLRGAENCSPDYSWYPNLPHSITFTSRGCPNRCPFCAVRKHEPKFIVKENWVDDIDITKTGIIFWDNNWLASPNFEKDVERLKKFREEAGITGIDFNQGLDCRLMDEEKVKLLSQIKVKPLRLAFDNTSEDGHIQKAIKLAQKYGFKDISVYVLYNCEDNHDTPEYFYYRINEITKIGAWAYPMRYRPVTSINGQYVSDKWDNKLLRALKLSLMFYYTKGMITENPEAFKKIYGDNAQQFKEKLYKIYEGDKSRRR